MNIYRNAVNGAVGIAVCDAVVYTINDIIYGAVDLNICRAVYNIVI